MSGRDEMDFEQLLIGHGNAVLTAEETRRLRELAAARPGWAAEVRAIDAIHARFADERRLFDAVARPVEAREEADEGYRRLLRAGARAEDELRHRLLHEPTVTSIPAPRWRRRLSWLVAAAAAAAILWFLPRGDVPPPMLDRRPDDTRLGGSAIVFMPQISRDARSFAWHQVVGASAYDASIVDAAGAVLLERSADQRSSSRWDLTPDEFDRLRGHPGGLFLRVVALDRAGVRISSSGELPFDVR
jgi:hypothetical protein